MYESTPHYTEQVATGRHIVVFSDSDDAPVRLLGACGIEGVADTRDASGPLAGATYFHELGMAVVDAGEERLAELLGRSRAEGRPVSVAPELWHRVLRPAEGDDGGAPGGSAPAEPGPGVRPAPGALPDAFADTEEWTWGLQATLAAGSPYTGRGIRVAVLDTGFDVSHPDFAGRSVVARSFVEGEDAADGHGHGTHCIGSACGPRTLDGGRGYGVASEAEIYAGKVLGADGSGSDASILAGIDWALASGCAVVSMSLGADVSQQHPPYVAAGRRALDKGTLLVAAAGNNARRADGDPGFVGTPANSPYIMAVAALDRNLAIADFSARTLAVRGGQVDTSGPGVEVYSAWPMPERYNTISGTSMATPHVAGVAALVAEATGLRGRALWAEVVQEARRLDLPSVDVASGLAQVPPPEDPGVPAAALARGTTAWVRL